MQALSTNTVSNSTVSNSTVSNSTVSNNNLSNSAVKQTLFDALSQFIIDYDLDWDQALQPEIACIADLGLSSVDFIQLVLAIESAFGQKFGFQDLLMQQGEYIEDVTVQSLEDFIIGKLNNPDKDKTAQVAVAVSSLPSEQRLQAAQIKTFKSMIAERLAELNNASNSKANPRSINSQNKNPRAIFVLAPPRSGSTLLRIILAGSPQLLSPPELHLLSYTTLAQRKAALAGEATQQLLQGTIRAIAQLQNCSVEAAEQTMAQCEQDNLTTHDFYRLLQSELGDRMLADKTPTYAFSPDTLTKAEQTFDAPIYIHLVRHPYGMIRSYEESKLERIVPIANANHFSTRELAELTWLTSHDNILNFLQDIPLNRQHRLRYEDLVRDPYSSVRRLCQALNIDFCPDMLDPYGDMQQRMTDGGRKVSDMSGDLKFYLHSSIDASAADRWKQFHQVDFLSQPASHLADAFGYEMAS